MLACSSSGGSGGGGAAGSSGSSGSGAFGAFGGSGGTPGDAGPGGASSGGNGSGGAGTGGTAGTGGAPLPTDVKDSAACTSFCNALNSACGPGTCDPKLECTIPAGQCAPSTEAFLQCQATTGSFSCGADGYSIIHNCKKDASACPPGTIAGASCKDYCGKKAPAGCYCDAECQQSGDCCGDYASECSGAGGSGSGGSSNWMFTAPKTCAEANNGKGCCGYGSSPYDQIAYVCVNGGVVKQSCGITGCVVVNGQAQCGDGSEYPSLPNCFQN